MILILFLILLILVNDEQKLKYINNFCVMLIIIPFILFLVKPHFTIVFNYLEFSDFFYYPLLMLLNIFIIKPIKLDLQKIISFSYNGTFITKLVENSTSTEAVQTLIKNPTLFSNTMISDFKLKDRTIPLSERTFFHQGIFQLNNSFIGNPLTKSKWKNVSEHTLSTLNLKDPSGNISLASALREREMHAPLNKFKGISYNMRPLYFPKRIKLQIGAAWQ